MKRLMMVFTLGLSFMASPAMAAVNANCPDKPNVERNDNTKRDLSYSVAALVNGNKKPRKTPVRTNGTST